MNALMRENSEAFVTDNEAIERSIASMREKMNRDYAALAAGQESLLEMARQTHSTLTENIYNVHISMRDKLDERHAALRAEQEALREKPDATSRDLHSKIDAARK